MSRPARSKSGVITADAASSLELSILPSRVSMDKHFTRTARISGSGAASRSGVLPIVTPIAINTLGLADADRAGLHRTDIGAVGRGERNISLGSAHAIADALGTTLVQLLVVRR